MISSCVEINSSFAVLSVFTASDRLIYFPASSDISLLSVPAVSAASFVFCRVSSIPCLYFENADVAIPITVEMPIMIIPIGLDIKAAFKLAPSPVTAAFRENVLVVAAICAAVCAFVDAVAAPLAAVCAFVACVSPISASFACICASSNPVTDNIAVRCSSFNALFDKICFNCASDNPLDALVKLSKAFAYPSVSLAIEDIIFREFKAVPKLLAWIADALNATDNAVIPFAMPISTNPLSVDSTSPRLFANCNTAFPAFKIPVTVLPSITD